MVELAKRSKIDPFFAMDVLGAANKLARTGKPVISMAVGQPAAPAPQAVLEAAQRALVNGHIGYTDSLGLMALREAIAEHYDKEHGVAISPERIAVTTGSSAAFNLAFLAYFDVGDRVAITRPGYPAYRNIMRTLGIEVVEIETSVQNGGILTAQALLAAHKQAPLKGVLFASPANPTGASLPIEEFQAVMRVARENNIHVISDEIYHRLNYSTPDITALQFSDDVTVINSFSKYYCMTGWRIGWMVLPQNAVRAVERIAQSLYISAPELSQFAAIAAFEATDELEKVKDIYRRNRSLLMEHLPKLGFDLLAPLDGAFYAYCDVSRFTNDSMAFAGQMLDETFVAATPGVDFDPVEGNRSIRFSYAGSLENMEEAIVRLQKWPAIQR